MVGLKALSVELVAAISIETKNLNNSDSTVAFTNEMSPAIKQASVGRDFPRLRGRQTPRKGRRRGQEWGQGRPAEARSKKVMQFLGRVLGGFIIFPSFLKFLPPVYTM